MKVCNWVRFAELDLCKFMILPIFPSSRGGSTCPPSGVFGSVDFWALRRLATICLVDIFFRLPSWVTINPTEGIIAQYRTFARKMLIII
jgi:hypothetical protein